MADSGVWRAMWDIVHRQFPAAQLVSAYRPGAITSTGNLSWHSRGNATDIAGPDMPGYFEWLKLNYPNSAELIYTPAGNRQIKNGQEHKYTGGTIQADHYSHVHWAMEGLPGSVGATLTPGTAASATASTGNPVTDAVAALSDGALWLRIGAFLAAAALIILAALRFIK